MAKQYTELKDTDAKLAEAGDLQADIQSKLTVLQTAAASKVEQGIALSGTLQDKKVPLQVKLIKTLEFLKGPLLGCISATWRAFCCVLPYYEKIFAACEKFYHWAPKKLLTMVFGVVLCFFGGTYVASLAAIEAFRNMGGERLLVDLKHVYGQLKLVNEANERDEAAAAADANDDNYTAAELLEQEKYGELAQKKLFLGMQAIDDPKRLERAAGALWSAYVAVLATLALQFARVVAIALGMAETIKPLFDRVFRPILEYVMAPKLHHWIGSIISVTLNLIVMWIAWMVITVVASVYSGLRGGRMFAVAFMGLIIENDYIAKIPNETVKRVLADWFTPEHDEKTGEVNGYKGYLDEVIGYTLAFLGVYWQISSGYTIFFPLNIVLLPLSIIETFLKWQIFVEAAGLAG